MIDKKALITGFTGQDGSFLTKFLLSKGYLVYGVLSDRNKEDPFSNLKKLDIKIENIKTISFSDISSLNLEEFEIYNLAAQSSVGLSWSNPLETFEINVNKYVELLNLCKGKNVKIFQACSGEMYGERNSDLLKESDCMNPQSPYSLSKYTSFNYGKMMRETEGMFIVNGILFNHESKLRDSKFVIRKIIDSVKDIIDGRKKFLELGNIDIKRDWGFAQDYVEVIWNIMQEDKSQDINIATGTSISLKKFIEYVFLYFGVENYEQYIKINPEFIRSNDISNFNVDISKLKRLGFSLSPITQDSIHRII